MLGRRKERLPDAIDSAVDLAKREQVIVWAPTTEGSYFLATTFRLIVVRPAGGVAIERPWHLVDSGHWDADTWTLTASWVDGSRAGQWTFERGVEGRLPEAFRERVQATVLASEPLQLGGPRRSGRVVLRKDLATQEVFVQPVLGRTTPADDAEVRREVERLSAFLGEQAGL